MNNRVIRQLIFTNCLLKRDVAERIGISLFTFSHWLQSEMTDTQRNRTMKAIEELTTTTEGYDYGKKEK